MKLIVGLGNIGSKYTKTRHNAGFMVIDELAKELNLEWKEETKFQAILAKSPKSTNTQSTAANSGLILAKPTTFMNLSGEAVSKLLNFHKIDPQNLVVVYDDIDLPLGTIRYRESGSAGTHNGMKSIIEHLGTQDFHRLRIGIESRGELTPKQMDTSAFVLSPFTDPELPLLKNSVKSAMEKLKEMIEENFTLT